MRLVIPDALPAGQIQRLKTMALCSKYGPGKVSLLGNASLSVDSSHRKVGVSVKTLPLSTSAKLERTFAEVAKPTSEIKFPYNWEYFLYKPGDHYNWHSDAYDSVKDKRVMSYNRAFSLILMLSDHKEYVGGEFEFFDGVKYELRAGELLVFSSDLKSNDHRVNLVSSGTRVVASCWGYYHG